LRSEEGLRRSERIRQEFEYREVIRNGRLMTGRTFKAYLLIRVELDRKAGFIAGKHVGNACLRNRAKRLLREAYRKLKPCLPGDGFRVVFVAKPSTPLARLLDIKDEMVWMFGECGLMQSS
jgi:ribonuclease P protein component